MIIDHLVVECLCGVFTDVFPDCVISLGCLLFTGAVPAAVPGFQPTLAAITEAQKHSKYAVSALGFEDVKSAVKNLTDALKLLTQP